MEIYQPPLSMVQGFPQNRRAGLLMRHSERFPILKDEDVYTVGLTTEGFRQAEKLGQGLAPIRQPGRILASPVGRCLDTASSIGRGAGWSTPVVADYRLSHPFIEPAWKALPIHSETDPMPDVLGGLLDCILEGDDRPGSIDVFVTHDTILAVVAEYFTGHHFFYPGYWPEYLEGILIWRNESEVRLRWRDEERVIGPWPTTRPCQLALEL